MLNTNLRLFKKCIFVSLALLLAVLPLVAKAQSWPDQVENYAEESGLSEVITAGTSYTDPITKIEFACLLATGANITESSSKTTFADISTDKNYCANELSQRGYLYFTGTNPNFGAGETLQFWSGLSLTMRYFGYYDNFVRNPEEFEKLLPGLSASAFYAETLSRALELGIFDPTAQDYAPTRKLTRADAVYAVAIMQALDSALYGDGSEFELPTGGSGIGAEYLDEGFLIFENTNFPILADVYERIVTDYLDQDKIDSKQLIYGAIRGMTLALDPYSVFFDPQELAGFDQSVNGEFTGIGVSLNISDSNQLEIISPLSGSPAEKAGLKSGDIIIKIDDYAVNEESTIEDAIDRIGGKEGTSVSLTISRGSQQLTFKITRSVIKLPEVEVTESNSVLTVKIHTFGDNTGSLLRSELKKRDLTKIKGVIVDLRNNPGGFLDTALEIAELFLPNGSVVTKVQGPDIYETVKTDSEPLINNVKVVVLVNGGSASASEILAAALQYNLKATVVGEQTYGKGTVQDVIRYSNNSAFKYTIAQWLTPDEKTIHQLGITPDVKEADPIKQESKAKELVGG